MSVKYVHLFTLQCYMLHVTFAKFNVVTRKKDIYIYIIIYNNYNYYK